MAYVQSYSNTYGPVAQLAGLLDRLRGLPEMVGISIGTRPDCLNAEKAALLAAMPCEEVWVELGVQTFHDHTLTRINRGHDAAASERAIRLAAEAGVLVCAHLMVGLPGESAADFLASLRRTMDLPVRGIKLHNVYVSTNTALAQAYQAGQYVPLTREAYIELAVTALRELDEHRPDMIIHRVVADTVPDDLLAPDWVLDKHPTMLAIQKAMREPRT